jgi:hypothetical protein
VEHSPLFICYVNSGDDAVEKKKTKKEKGKARKADMLTLTVMLVAVERKPTMVHSGYDGGGQCLLHLFFFFPVQRHQPLFLFFSFLVCFYLVLLLLVSGGGGAAGGFQMMWWRLMDGGVAVGGDSGSSPLYAEA